MNKDKKAKHGAEKPEDEKALTEEKACEAETAEAEAEATSELDEADEAVNELQSQIDSLTNELGSIKDKLLRTAAEYDNYRKRTEREKSESASYGAANAISKMLGAIDALERAAEAECGDEAYKKGVLMTLAMFNSSLEQAGVEEIAALGEKFNPNFHNAVANDEPTEGQESGTVTRVLQKGYKIGSKIIRPSMVAVAQ